VFIVRGIKVVLSSLALASAITLAACGGSSPTASFIQSYKAQTGITLSQRWASGTEKGVCSITQSKLSVDYAADIALFSGGYQPHTTQERVQKDEAHILVDAVNAFCPAKAAQDVPNPLKTLGSASLSEGRRAGLMRGSDDET
jgi:hypothetical protein